MTIAIFANSAGWKVIGPELDAEVGAVDLLADPRHARQQQQGEADRPRSCSGSARARGSRAAATIVATKSTSPITNHCACSRASVVVDPVDHHEAEAGQHGDQREQVRVGVGQREADHDVRGEAEPEEDRAVGQRDVGEQRRALDEDRREAGGHQQRRRDQRQQLAVARAHHAPPAAPLELRDEVLRVVVRAQLVVVNVRLWRRRELVDRHARTRS